MSHFNYVHARIEISSMSKRIMNKVFEVANKCGVKTHYQDADSIHLNYDDVDKTFERHKDKYGQDLVGQGLGNFHVDLPPLCKDNEVYGIENYFLGKRTYLDMLEPTNEDNNIINGEHIRMRRIPAACIKYYAEQKITALDMYNKLNEGEAITFDLTNGLTKFVCKNNKDHTISNVTTFTRTTKYIRNPENKIFIN